MTELLFTFWFKDFNLKNVIKSFDQVASHYNHNFEFEHSDDGHFHLAVLRHGCGPRASAFYAEFVKSVLALLHVKVELKEAEEQIVAKLFVQKPDERLVLEGVIPDELRPQYVQPSSRQVA